MASPGFVRHQATELDTMLMAGSKGSLRDYLVKAVGENRPWDQIFRELMLPDQTDKVQKVAAEYLRQRVKDLDRLTADVSSTFFGVNISCAQCHDHPLVEDWKQDHFYGMKSFLNRTFVNGNGNAGFLGEHGYGTVRFKTTEGVEKQARMMFLTGRRVDDADCQRAVERRAEEGERGARPRQERQGSPACRPGSAPGPSWWSWRSQPGEREFFARAIVNRIWHRLFGQGLVMPLDQMHSANPPSHPDLLAWLARDMADARLRPPPADPRPGHEQRLRARLALGMATEAPRPSLFAVALVRPLTPMQLATLAPAGDRPTRHSLPADFQSDRFEKRIEAVEASARSLAASFTNSERRHCRSAWPRPCFSATARRIEQRPPGRRPRPAGRAPRSRRLHRPS